MRSGFAGRLRKLRLEKGWAQPELAARLGVTNGNVGNWEVGPSIPRPEILKKIAVLFDKEIQWLLNGDPPQFAQEELPEHLVDDFLEELQKLREQIFAVERAAARLRRRPMTLTEAQRESLRAAEEAIAETVPRPPAPSSEPARDPSSDPLAKKPSSARRKQLLDSVIEAKLSGSAGSSHTPRKSDSEPSSE
jgi:transcriptional regulator with XRE-family HTH domain